MTSRRVASLALAVVLLLGGATAVSIVVSPPNGDAPLAEVEQAEEDAAALDAPRRERRRVAPVPRAIDAATAPDDESSTEERAAEPVETEEQQAELLRPWQEALRELFDEVAHPGDVAPAPLVAEPERDPLRAADPSRVGAPPEMAFAAFVAGGVDSLDGAAELIGDRRPELEEGEPVALTGRVLDEESGEPLAGALAVVSSTFYVRRHLYDHHLREVARAYTDAAGEYTVPRVDVDPAHFGRGGRLYLTVTAPGHAPQLARPLARVSPGATSRIPDVRLAVAAHVLRGRVLDFWEGQPVAGARVFATGAIDPVAYPKDQRDAFFVGAPSAVTDDDGRFELTGLGDGVQVVSVHGGDDCIGRGTFVVPRDTDVQLRTRGIRGRIEGIVVDARGEPVPLVAVEGGGNSTHSFVDGRFVLENFRESQLAIVFSHPDYRRVTRHGVADGTADLFVRLEHHQPEIRLRVRRADDGAAVTAIRVVPRAAEGGAVRATSAVYLAEEGVHVLRIPEGAVTLTVAADGLRALDLDTAGLRDGDAVDVHLEPDGAE